MNFQFLSDIECDYHFAMRNTKVYKVRKFEMTAFH